MKESYLRVRYVRRKEQAKVSKMGLEAGSTVVEPPGSSYDMSLITSIMQTELVSEKDIKYFPWATVMKQYVHCL